MIGQIINGYEITYLIGKGGMAMVYKGKNPQGFTRAFKVVRPDRAENNPTLYKRFLKEIALLKCLSEHPNIVKAENVHNFQNTTVLEMEFLDGMDLKEYVEKKTSNGVQSGEELKKICLRILEALDYAHHFKHIDEKGKEQKGILHLDIKPNNIFRTKNGFIKLLDFGIAKVVGEQAEKVQGAKNLTVIKAETGESTFKGALAYSSPEQQAGTVLEVTSDIFSFGKTLHYIATGSEDMDVDVTIEPFASIVRKCTQQRRQDRFQSCQEIIDFIVGTPPPPPPPSRCCNPNCRKMIDNQVKYCPHCGWEQKQTKKICPNSNCKYEFTGTNDGNQDNNINIFIGGLSFKIDDVDLLNLFEKYGAIKSAKVIIDRRTGISKGYGFVEMFDREAAKIAIAELDGAEYDQKIISVSEARPKEKPYSELSLSQIKEKESIPNQESSKSGENKGDDSMPIWVWIVVIILAGGFVIWTISGLIDDPSQNVRIGPYKGPLWIGVIVFIIIGIYYANKD
jgi:serine/threonine protein kinase